MKLSSAIGGGLAGAVVLTLLHETLRRSTDVAPRMDLLGMEAAAKTLQKADTDVPPKDSLFKLTMAGDLLSNSLYYSVMGVGKDRDAILRGALLGIAAGIGAVYLPKPLGLNAAPSNRTVETKILTVSLYTIGGIVAGAVGKLIETEI